MIVCPAAPGFRTEFRRVADVFASDQLANTPRISEAEANAAFIVRACNAHEDLVAALREAQAALNGAPNTVGLHTQIDAALAKAGAA